MSELEREDVGTDHLAMTNQSREGVDSPGDSGDVVRESTPRASHEFLDPAAAARFSALEIVGHHSSDFIIVVDENADILYGNPVAQRIFGLTPEEGVGTNATTYTHPDDLERVAASFDALIGRPGASFRDTVKTVRADGDIRVLEIVVTNSLDNPLVAGVIFNGQDVTERDSYVAQLEVLEERFRMAFQGNMAPMGFTAANDKILDVNEAFCELVGYSREEIIGSDSTLFTHPDDIGISEETVRRALEGDSKPSRYVKRYVRKDGRVIVVEVSRAPARDRDGNVLYFVISERDITEERELMAQLSTQALHDPLTDLANRTLFDDRLAQAHARVARRGDLGAVFLLDLDDFKGVNDAYGHVVGDELLHAIAHRLQHVTRASDTLCRFGGDEFLYLAEELSDDHEAELMAERMLRALEEPFDLAGSSFVQRASMGVVTWDASSPDTSEIVQHADVALYEAKRLGRGRYVLFTPDMQRQALSRFTLIQELSQASRGDELSMYYQPIIDLATNQVAGFEALMRWRHETHGFVSPDVFIPLAEESNLIIDLGAFAIREAVAAAASWISAVGLEAAPRVTVNLSARQFHSPTLIPTLEAELGRHNLPVDRLILEITESAALGDVTETLNVIAQLDQLGVRIALDDFGTGFSSLSYLVQLHPRIIKIDQSFVRPAATSPESDAVLELIFLLGQKLGVITLAEGVETSEQLARIRSFGCQYGQGFLWSPAVPLDEVATVCEKLQPPALHGLQPGE